MPTQAELRELSDEQLVHSALEVEHGLVGLRFEHSMSRLENTAELGQLRKQIARIKTEARRREIDRGLGKDTLFQAHSGSFRKKEGEVAEGEDAGFLSGIVDKLSGKE